MNSLHQLLKSETQPFHRKLEAHPLQQLLLSPNLDEHSLQQILLAYLGFYMPVEAKLASFVSAVHPTYAYQSPNLLLDLIVIQTEMRKLLICEKLPVIQSNLNVLGILYVFEGAHLGARVIDKHLKSILPSTSIQFFEPKNDSLADSWINFVNILESTLLTKSQTTTVVHSAIETFTCFESWLVEIA